MKAKLKIISILFLSFTACDSSDSDGKWSDNIKLSTKEFTVNAEPNLVTAKTEGTWWWISDIGLNDDWSYDFSKIDTTQDNFLIEQDEFTIERKNANEIYISISENESDIDRTLIISLQAGNYFDAIKITQSANGK